MCQYVYKIYTLLFVSEAHGKAHSLVGSFVGKAHSFEGKAGVGLLALGLRVWGLLGLGLQGLDFWALG